MRTGNEHEALIQAINAHLHALTMRANSAEAKLTILREELVNEKDSFRKGVICASMKALREGNEMPSPVMVKAKLCRMQGGFAILN